METAQLLRTAKLDAIVAERCRRSFHRFFVEFAWPVLQPGVEFRDNWHIHAICEHLEAVKAGEIKKLCINMPFRQLKSTIVSQAFMAWDWIDSPHLQYMTASYATDLATRDAVASRRIIESDKYRAAYGSKFRLTTDQNVKTRYENDKGGGRVIVSPESKGTGFGGNRRIVDDPINPRQADSPTYIESGVEWWRGTLGTRANDPKNDSLILVQQRLNEKDTTGYIMKHERGWEFLILPMRYERKHTRTTCLGWRDPRKKEGELMMPSRLGEPEVKGLEDTLGVYHTNAQLQQRPDPRGGVIFDRSKWKFYEALPTIKQTIISVDCTFKDLQTSDHVAIQAWGVTQGGADKYLLRRVKERMSFTATCTAVRAMYALYPRSIAVLIEDKANGSAVIETIKSRVPRVIAIQPEGGKAARAYAMQPEQEAGNIWLPSPEVDPKVEIMVSACSSFTGAEGGDDDEVDAMTQAINWLRVRQRSMGMQDFMAAQAEIARREQEAREASRRAG